eukprot:NODE_4736_length_645_cov_285.154237.p1 GENE.NODE_4736_length_645_cov_285.154237~~NODE_4736_length_645_cov_285.154237.p1  ORF type:complete len:171 (-),score=46.96 NODE_4736_length_645_cov_285.154237:115-627(-)
MGGAARHPAGLADAALRLLGLAHALAWCAPHGERLRAAAFSSLLAAGAALEGAPLEADNADLVMACSQVLTALQCLAAYGGPLERYSLEGLTALRATLSAVEPALAARGVQPRREGKLAQGVFDAAEALYTRAALHEPHSAFGQMVPCVEEPVMQYFVDFTLSPRGRSSC